MSANKLREFYACLIVELQLVSLEGAASAGLILHQSRAHVRFGVWCIFCARHGTENKEERNLIITPAFSPYSQPRLTGAAEDRA